MKIYSLSAIFLGITVFSFTAFASPKNKTIERMPNSVACSESSASRKAEALVLYLLASNQHFDKGLSLSTTAQRINGRENTDYYKVRVTPGGIFVGTFEVNIENESGCEITSVKRLGAG